MPSKFSTIVMLRRWLTGASTPVGAKGSTLNCRLVKYRTKKILGLKYKFGCPGQFHLAIRQARQKKLAYVAVRSDVQLAVLNTFHLYFQSFYFSRFPPHQYPPPLQWDHWTFAALHQPHLMSTHHWQLVLMCVWLVCVYTMGLSLTSCFSWLVLGAKLPPFCPPVSAILRSVISVEELSDLRSATSTPSPQLVSAYLFVEKLNKTP